MRHFLLSGPGTMLVIGLFMTAWGAGTSGGEDDEKAVVFSRAAFILPEPDVSAVTLKLLKRGDAVMLLGRKVDSLDRMWYQVLDAAGDTGWVDSRDMKILSQLPADSGSGGSAPATVSKLTRRDRFQYVKKHPELSRRTRKLILDGFAGMDMRHEDVKAALGPPDAVRTILLLKRGSMDLWLYHPDAPVVLIFEDGKVSGWSKE